MVDKGNPLMMTNSTATAVAENVEQVVRRRLSTAPTYAFTFERIDIDFADGTLTLRGQLPSFYLKQLLQAQLRDVEGVDQVSNQVQVREQRRHPVEAVDELSNPWS
jgi:osmotically-inducible protein OsmY